MRFENYSPEEMAKRLEHMSDRALENAKEAAQEGSFYFGCRKIELETVEKEMERRKTKCEN